MASILEVIRTIRQRTPMYIGQKSISCLRAFLDGWVFAHHGQVDDASVMDDFQRWVAGKCGVQESRAWDRVILFHSQDEAQALDTFFVWFDEFLTATSAKNRESAEA
jgi:hypothetical protein